jgi:hypothetical protein
MKDGGNGDALRGRLIECFEREASDERPPELVHRDRIEMRVALDYVHARLYTPQELLAQPRLPALVPM